MVPLCDAGRPSLAPGNDLRVDWVRSAPFLAIQLSVLAIPFLGWGAREAAVAAATYGLGMFFVTAGFHRYFAHRAFRTSRSLQLLLALGATSTVQHGVLWWAGHHRDHHRTSDGPDDVHSPSRGLLWSHMGWFLCNRHDATPLARVRDLARFAELRWLDRFYWIPPLLVGLAALAAGGWRLAVGGYLLGIVLLHHATFSINSLAHLWGTRPYPTGDQSRNNALLALLTFGEGWHNNHHHYPTSARQGFRWWQLDLTWCALRLLELLGLVWDLRPAPAPAPVPVPAGGRGGPATGTARPGPRRAARAAASALTAATMLLPSRASASVERFEGTARSPEGQIAYVEEHEVRRESGRLVAAETRYLSPEGQLIAVLRSDYTRDPFAPDYRFEDLRTGSVEVVRRIEGGVELFANGRWRLLPPDGSLPLVAGQGLDRFARARIEELVRGGELRVEMVLPSRLDSYRFRVRAEAAGEDGLVRVRIEPASLLLRLLAPSIVAEYDRATGRLLRYRGVSNLAGPDGDVQEVEIVYREIPS
jgi:stearoyl-CoA desaturase (delta-9 desaturase)